MKNHDTSQFPGLMAGKENVRVQNSAQFLRLKAYIISQFIILAIIYIVLSVYGMDVK